MSDKDIEALVEGSSLGTPEAKAARESVSDEAAARIVARSWQIEAEDLRAQIRALLEEREDLTNELRHQARGNHPAGRALRAVEAREWLALREALTERDAEHEGGGGA